MDSSNLRKYGATISTDPDTAQKLVFFLLAAIIFLPPNAVIDALPDFLYLPGFCIYYKQKGASYRPLGMLWRQRADNPSAQSAMMFSVG